MERRQFLKLLLSGVAGHTLDLDRLLWIPGQKVYFLPSSPGLSVSEILAIELEKLIPKIHDLFNRDDKFYATLRSREIEKVSGRPMTVPVRLQDEMIIYNKVLTGITDE